MLSRKGHGYGPNEGDDLDMRFGERFRKPGGTLADASPSGSLRGFWREFCLDPAIELMRSNVIRALFA